MSKTPSKGTRKRRKTPDWEAIERHYRIGQLSNAEIGAKFGVTRKAVWEHAKRNGWLKDLSSQVSVLAQAKLSRQDAVSNTSGDGSSRARAEGEAVEMAADTLAKLVMTHRNDIARLRAISARLMKRLEIHLKAVEDDTPEKATAEERKLREVDMGSVSKLVTALAGAMAKTIPLERQAFNADGARPPAEIDDDLPESVRERLAIYNR